MRDALLYHVISGQAFFTGVALIGLGLILAPRAGKRGIALGWTLAACLGLVLVVVSATPLPAWFYAIAGTVSIVWIVVEGFRSATLRRPLPWLRAGVLSVWGLGIALELPYHLMPALPRLADPPVYVVADSLAAGMGSESLTWPKLLARDHGLDVRDLARAGSTAAMALRDQAGRVTEARSLVVVEIGGNDLLGGTEPRAFARSLDALLTRLRAGGRTVVMLELPLFPFANAYGIAQRRLARRHGVFLVPKRVLLGVLLRPEATLDTVHLSPAGHEAMAGAVWDVIRPAYGR